MKEQVITPKIFLPVLRSMVRFSFISFQFPNSASSFVVQFKIMPQNSFLKDTSDRWVISDVPRFIKVFVSVCPGDPVEIDLSPACFPTATIHRIVFCIQSYLMTFFMVLMPTLFSSSNSTDSQDISSRYIFNSPLLLTHIGLVSFGFCLILPTSGILFLFQYLNSALKHLKNKPLLNNIDIYLIYV